MSWARCCALNCTCWLSHDAVKDVRPPIADPASAAKAEKYAGSMTQSPHCCPACNQRLRLEEGRTGREKCALRTRAWFADASLLRCPTLAAVACTRLFGPGLAQRPGETVPDTLPSSRYRGSSHRLGCWEGEQ